MSSFIKELSTYDDFSREYEIFAVFRLAIGGAVICATQNRIMTNHLFAKMAKNVRLI